MVAASALLRDARPSQAVVEPVTANDSDYLSLGDQYLGRTVYVLAYASGSGDSGSGVLLDPWDVLTAAHVIADSGPGVVPSVYIGTGSNIVTDPGTVTPVASEVIFPGWSGDADSSPDLAILHLAEPMGNNALAIAAPVSGEILTGSGFGNRATSDGTVYPLDAFIRGWNAPVDSSPPDIPAAAFYFDTDFQAGDSSFALPGNAFFGDSGGPWFDSSDNLVGLTVTGPDTPSGDMTTMVLNLSQPSIEQWILANTGAPVPEPLSAALLAVPFFVLLLQPRIACGRRTTGVEPVWRHSRVAI